MSDLSYRTPISISHIEIGSYLVTLGEATTDPRRRDGPWRRRARLPHLPATANLWSADLSTLPAFAAAPWRNGTW